MIAEIQAGIAYETSTLADGEEDAAACLEKAAADAGEIMDVCQPIPDATLDGGNTDRTMYGTTSLVAFAGLLQNVQIDAVIKVICKVHKCGHIVMLGPKGFHLCSCLKLLRCGMPCRHFFAAAVTHLERENPLDGLCIHPRWRASSDTWSVEGVLGAFDGHERGGHIYGCTDDGGGVSFRDDEDARNAVRTKFVADMTAVAKREISRAAGNLSDENINVVKALFSQLPGSLDSILGGDAAGTGGAPSVHEERGQGGAQGTARGRVVVDPAVPIDRSRRNIPLPDSGAPPKRQRREGGAVSPGDE